jgi:hypothetical protein
MVPNTLMAGWLQGLFIYTAIGRFLLLGRPRSSDQRPARGFILLAVMFILIGLLSSILGRLIQAAFCRKRETLADASAVQYTRDARGLAGVFKKIGGLNKGSLIRLNAHPGLSHFFMAKPEPHSLFDTHPPLSSRIWALEPDWDGYCWDFGKNPVDYLSSREPMMSWEEKQARLRKEKNPDIGPEPVKNLPVAILAAPMASLGPRGELSPKSHLRARRHPFLAKSYRRAISQAKLPRNISQP